MYYYIVQQLSNNIYIHGPWKTEEARDRRYESIQGGEVYKFNSFSQDSNKVRQEFKDEKVKTL